MCMQSSCYATVGNMNLNFLICPVALSFHTVQTYSGIWAWPRCVLKSHTRGTWEFVSCLKCLHYIPFSVYLDVLFYLVLARDIVEIRHTLISIKKLLIFFYSFVLSANLYDIYILADYFECKSCDFNLAQLMACMDLVSAVWLTDAKWAVGDTLAPLGVSLGHTCLVLGALPRRRHVSEGLEWASRNVLSLWTSACDRSVRLPQCALSHSDVH